AMVWLAGAEPGQVVLDPMCGGGTILAEQLAVGGGKIQVWGGDREAAAVRAAGANLRRLGPALLSRPHAPPLPLPDQSADRVISNPPFGKQLGRPEDIGPLYRRMVAEYNRVLRPHAQAVLLVADFPALRDAASQVGWQRLHQFRVRVLGQPAAI